MELPLTVIILILLILLAETKFNMDSTVEGWPFSGQVFNIETFGNYVVSLVDINNTQIIQTFNAETSEISTKHLNSQTVQNVQMFNTGDSSSPFLIYSFGTLEIMYSNCSKQVIRNQNIKAYCFGKNQNTIYYAEYDGSNTNIYESDMINITVIIETFSRQIKQLKFINSKLYAFTFTLQSDYIDVYATTETPFTTSHEFLMDFPIDPNSKFRTNGHYYLYLGNGLLTVYNSSNLVHIQSVYPSDTDLIFVGQNYLITRDNDAITQINVEHFDVMQSIPNTLNNPQIYSLTNNIFIISSVTNNIMQLYQLEDIYVCLTSCSCHVNYDPNGNECQINIFQEFGVLDDIPPVPVVLFQNSLMETCNIQIIPPPPPPPISNSSEEAIEEIQQSEEIEENLMEQNTTDQWVFEFSKILGNTLSVAYFPTFLKATAPIIIFLEDMWFYQFHKNIVYTNFMELCMRQVDIINVLRVKPEFMSLLYWNISLENSYYNQIYGVQMKNKDNYSGLEEINFYEIEAIADVIYPSSLLHFAPFVILFFMRILLTYCCNPESIIFRDLIQAFRNRTPPWILLCMLIEPNLARLTFASFNQMTILSRFEAVNFLNLILAIGILFVLVPYCLSFYSMVYKYSKKSSKTLLMFTQFNHQSFALESLGLCFTKFLRSFAHSYFFTSHREKLIILTCLNITFVWVYFYYRKYFHNRITLVVYISYEIAFLVLNIMLLLHFSDQNMISESIYEKIVFWLILILVGIVGFKTFLAVYSEIRDIVMYFIQRNTQIIQAQHNSVKQLINDNNQNVQSKIQKECVIESLQKVEKQKTLNQKRQDVTLSITFIMPQKQNQEKIKKKLKKQTGRIPNKIQNSQNKSKGKSKTSKNVTKEKKLKKIKDEANIKTIKEKNDLIKYNKNN